MNILSTLLLAVTIAGFPLDAPPTKRDQPQLSPDVYYDFLFLINDNARVLGNTDQLVMQAALNDAADNKARLAAALKFDPDKLPYMDVSEQTWMIASSSDVGSVVPELKRNGKIGSELKRSKYRHVGVGSADNYWVVVLEK
ncbi:hypothetical protein EC988_002549 [Linderina pennispora]|nr:hypothetical protein EC988_002549 [Linderina pennispora]